MFTSKSLLSETTNLLRSNKISATDYVQEITRVIETKESKIRALLPEENYKNRLINQAKNLEKQFPVPNKRPALYGIPVGIKDIINAQGFDTKGGSKLSPKLFLGKEASLVSKLKNAGALILGKTITTEFAYFEPGPTRNPHNIEHTPGGSSSGSAVAVASGYTPLAIGTQTIGSVIRPAAYCGIIGFKPSYNRIAKDGVIPFSTSADHIGFFTQDIDGVSLAASVLCDNWNIKPIFSNNKPVIGVIVGKYLQQANSKIIELFEIKLEQLQKNGYKIVRIKAFENIEEINRVHRQMISAEFSIVHEEWYDKHSNSYRNETKNLIHEGREVTVGELSKARLNRNELRNYIEKIKIENQIDLWLSPSSTTLAPKGTSTGSPLMNLPWTYAGLPTITIPAGKSTDNLPFGLQFTGSFMQDEKLVAQLQSFLKK